MQLAHGIFTAFLLVGTCYIVSIQAQTQGQITCGCSPSFCNSTVLNRLTGNVTCGERIEYLMNAENFTELDACLSVTEFYPDICGPLCHPEKCRPQVPDYCGCFSCTDAQLDLLAGNFTCRERIRSVQEATSVTEEEACRMVSNQFIFECGGLCHPDKCDGKDAEFCGCNECAREDLNQSAGDDSTTCWDRIHSVLLENGDLPEQAACEFVAEQFPR